MNDLHNEQHNKRSIEQQLFDYITARIAHGIVVEPQPVLRWAHHAFESDQELVDALFRGACWAQAWAFETNDSWAHQRLRDTLFDVATMIELRRRRRAAARQRYPDLPADYDDLAHKFYALRNLLNQAIARERKRRNQRTVADLEVESER